MALDATFHGWNKWDDGKGAPGEHSVGVQLEVLHDTIQPFPTCRRSTSPR
jgi:hypothetical protein